MTCQVVGVFPSEQAAEQAVSMLANEGLDITKMTIVLEDFRTEERITGRYNPWRPIFLWAILGFIFGCLFFGPLFFPASLEPAAPGLLFGGVIANGLMIGICVAIFAAFFAFAGRHKQFDYNITVVPRDCCLWFDAEEPAIERARQILARIDASADRCRPAA